MTPTALDLTEEALELLASGRTDAARLALESLAIHLRSSGAAPGRWHLLPRSLRRAGTHPAKLLRKVAGRVSTSFT